MLQSPFTDGRDYTSEFDDNIPLTDSDREVCFDVVAFDDVELEQSEFVSFILIIDTGINTTVARSMTTITILDNDSMYINNGTVYWL